MRAGKGSVRLGVNGCIGEDGTNGGKRKRPGMTERTKYTTAIRYRREREVGGRQCEGGHSGWGGGER